MENILFDIFLAFWSILDVIFSFIDESFTLVFNALPSDAIPYVIGIFVYSVIAIMVVIITAQDKGNKKLALKLFYYCLVLISILYTIWRFGIISMIEPEITASTVSEFVVNIIYVVFAMLLVVSFLRKITWLKKAIIFLLWFLLLLITFVLAPAFSEFQLSDSTLIQVLLLAAIFIVPSGYHKIQQAKRSGVD